MQSLIYIGTQNWTYMHLAQQMADGTKPGVDLTDVDRMTLTLDNGKTLSVTRNQLSPALDWWSDDLAAGAIRVVLGPWAASNNVEAGDYFGELRSFTPDSGSGGWVWTSVAQQDWKLIFIEQ